MSSCPYDDFDLECADCPYFVYWDEAKTYVCELDDEHIREITERLKKEASE